MDSTKLNHKFFFHKKKKEFRFPGVFIIRMWGKKSASFFRNIQIYGETIDTIRKGCVRKEKRAGCVVCVWLDCTAGSV